MNLKKSIVILTVIAVFIILMSVFALVSFPVSGTVYDYHGYATTIDLGLDLSGGISAVFGVQDDGLGNLESRVDGAVSTLQSMLASEGFAEATVAKTSSDGSYAIRVETADVSGAEDMLDLLGPARLQFVGSSSQGTPGSTLPSDAEVALEGSQHLADAYASMQNTGTANVGVVVLVFNEAGTQAFSDLTGDSSYVNIYFNGSLLTSVQISSQITNGVAVISGSWDYSTANDYAMRFRLSTLGVTLDDGEVVSVSPTFGDGAVLAAIIAVAVCVGVAFIVLAVMYRGLGLAAIISVAVDALVLIWFCAVLPWVQLTIAGIAGLILSVFFAADANIVILERIRGEYRNSLKPIPSAVKAGFKRSLGAVIDSCVAVLVFAIMLWAIGSAASVGLAVTLLVGIILAAVSSLLLTRVIINCFLPVNSTSEKFYGLKRAEEEEHEQESDFLKNDVVTGGEVK